MAVLAHGFYLPPPTRTPKSSNRKLVGYSSSIIVRRRLLTDGNECVQVSELFTPKTFRIRSFYEEDAGNNEVEISKDILDGEDGISDELLGNVVNTEISTENSFLAKIAIALGVAATVTLISVGIKGAPAIGSSNGIQIFPDSSSSSVMASANVSFTIKAFGYSIVLPAFAPGWIYFWLLMAAGCGLCISEEALNIWVGISLARMLSLDGTWQMFAESFSRNAPYIISTILWVYWGVCISDLIPFYLGKLFRKSRASDDVFSKLGIGKEKALSITSAVQKYGNLIGFDAFPPSLCQFVIEDCAELSSLQGGHASPEELSITNCPKLWKSSVANHGKSQTALWKLVITSCGPEMTSTPSALLRTFLYTIAYPFAN
ncbi:hypothetical protein DVH24_010397 [Malus domestica]|uniref:Uncharacterized protein n=1 Tax=Malus domestica TaxID=3750 RepID=A0A498JX56_MALDO|nr:hypothetical protein DVH24_010397 [Malus domestica]